MNEKLPRKILTAFGILCSLATVVALWFIAGAISNLGSTAAKDNIVAEAQKSMEPTPTPSQLEAVASGGGTASETNQSPEPSAEPEAESTPEDSVLSGLPTTLTQEEPAPGGYGKPVKSMANLPVESGTGAQLLTELDFFYSDIEEEFTYTLEGCKETDKGYYMCSEGDYVLVFDKVWVKLVAVGTKRAESVDFIFAYLAPLHEDLTDDDKIIPGYITVTSGNPVDLSE